MFVEPLLKRQEALVTSAGQLLLRFTLPSVVTVITASASVLPSVCAGFRLPYCRSVAAFLPDEPPHVESSTSCPWNNCPTSYQRTQNESSMLCKLPALQYEMLTHS